MTQVVLNALSISSLYILAAMGLTLIFGVLRLVQFAHGEMAILAGYVFVRLWHDADVHVALAALAAIAAVTAFSALQFELIMRRVLGAPHLNGIVATIGVALAMEGTFGIVFHHDPRGISNEITRTTVSLGSASISLPRAIGIATAVLVLVALAYVLKRTEFGRRLRAVAQDPEIAELMGIDSLKIRRYVFILGSAMTSVSGMLLVSTSSITPTSGLSLTIVSYAIVILGGRGSASGAILGGLIVAFAEAFVAAYVPDGTSFRTAVVFVVIIAIALARPAGLRGRTA